MIDTHSHLWFDHFKDDLDQVIERAREAGVHTMVQVGCDEQSSRQSVDFAEQHEGMLATVGYHPTEWNDQEPMTNDQVKDHLVWIRELLDSSEKIVAIGETGIDYYHQPYNPELQKLGLAYQCEMAQEYDLPVIIHLRMNKRPVAGADGLNQAEHDCLEVLDGVQLAADKVIFHCFSGSLKMAEEVVKRGWLISFSGVVTYPNAGELREVAKMVPDEQFVVETDCPFLPPQKYRGERNEPAYVCETALVVSQARGVTVQEVEELTDANAKRVFGI